MATNEYTTEQREKIIEHVLDELSAGIPLSKTLGPDREEWLCSLRCFWKWYYQADADDPNGLVHKVTRARHVGVEARMERALEIAETPMPGLVKREKDVVFEGKVVGKAVETVEEDMIAHRRLMVDTAIKSAQMLKPKTYSPKLDVTSGGETINFAAQLEAARKRAQGSIDEDE